MPTIRDKGAPAAAGRLEDHEAQAEQDVVRIKGEIEALTARIPQLDGLDEAQRRAQNELSALRDSLSTAYDLWFKLSRQVRDYYKAVDSSKREGEKIPIADASEFFRQFDLSIILAIESYIISQGQDAARCESPEQFYTTHAENIRSCRVAAIEKAQKDGKLPTWAKIE